MTFTVQSKSQLAKLLATENISIEHQKIQTAMFDPKNRVLYCPIWEDMSGDMYDLLMGHEVGHALYTPAEGWHDAASSLGKNFKGFLNVVEDARIEKKVKRRYPGIRTSFVSAYKKLLDRDFFGIKNRDINTLSFIDRLNLYTKSSGLLPIHFTNEEQKMVNDVENCETWDDVLRITKTIFDYSKDEQFETLQELMSNYPSDSTEDELDDYSDDTGESSDEQSEYGDQNIGDSDNVESNGDGESDSENNGDESDDEQLEQSNQLNRFKNSQLDKSDFQPQCLTDEEFRKNETQLVSANCKPYTYVTLPEPIIENIVTPYNVVQRNLEEYYFKTPESVSRGNEDLQKFKSRNDRYIGLLAKEFEMKKAARAYNKSKISNTGDIDINKIYKYQIEDNIFRKMSRVPKGKSHGLVLLLDRSGSMHDNMAGSIEQILILTMFCRKVNIPFVVYGFGNSCEGRRADYPTEERKNSFKVNNNDIIMEHVFLREYMNSRMGNAEFNRCLRNMVALMDSYQNTFCRYRQPPAEHLSNTPLIEAMIALVPITNQFRKINNLDLVNLVVVHDGDSDTLNLYRNESAENGLNYGMISPSRENVFIREGKKNYPIEYNSNIHSSEMMRTTIFNWFRDKTDVKIFGFFLAGKGKNLKNSLMYRYFNEKGETVSQIVDKYELKGQKMYSYRFRYDRSVTVEKLAGEIKSNKFLHSHNPGYNSFFILPCGEELKVQDEGLVINGNVTASKLKTAFMRVNKKKQVNRVLVSRFIEGIAV